MLKKTNFAYNYAFLELKTIQLMTSELKLQYRFLHPNETDRKQS